MKLTNDVRAISTVMCAKNTKSLQRKLNTWKRRYGVAFLGIPYELVSTLSNDIRLLPAEMCPKTNVAQHKLHTLLNDVRGAKVSVFWYSVWTSF